MLAAHFDRIFTSRTGYATLDRLLARLHANKTELLMVLECPEIPLHTNGTENDIRRYVIWRNISAGTRSDAGRDYRDVFLGLVKTYTKQRGTFWDYLGSRLQIPGAPTSAAARPHRESRRANLIARDFAPVTFVPHKILVRCHLEGAMVKRESVGRLTRTSAKRIK